MKTIHETTQRKGDSEITRTARLPGEGVIRVLSYELADRVLLSFYREIERLFGYDRGELI